MTYSYDVALSFAGEDREFAEAVASGLRAAGIKVFYDDYYAADLWGEDLSVGLRKVYHEASRFCIMIISAYYVEKMWPNFERQQAIERLIRQKGKTYILPVRLDGFSGTVSGLSETIGFLAVDSREPDKVVGAFLEKIGKQGASNSRITLKPEPPPDDFIPRLTKEFTDKEKNLFLKESFDEIISLLEHFASETRKQYPHFDYEAERVTTRKAVFTLYDNEKQATQFKVWIGGMFGSNSISFSHGNQVDIENDSSLNESFSVEDKESELVLKPMGIGMFGEEKDRTMSPKEAAEYLWKLACQSL